MDSASFWTWISTRQNPGGVASGTLSATEGGSWNTREFGTVPPAGLFEVHVCKGKRPPPDAYVAVEYRGHWFYIDDCDLASKATFLLVLKMSRVDFGQRLPGPSGPVLTLPVGR